MPAPLSAGILLWRRRDRAELLLVHFGGPYWARKDEGAWSIPKGLVEPGETSEDAARREFQEELGHAALGALTPFPRVKQKGGKLVDAFALEGELNAEAIVSNSFIMEWPPRSGRMQSYPEVDRAAWFDLGEARRMILPSLLPLLEHFEQLVLGQPA